MNLPREPLHQPPDPELIRAFPPESPACALVRGLLRDYADGDLAKAEARCVEEHVHGCRLCADMLSAAEREAMMLRSLAAGGKLAIGSGLAPSVGSAARQPGVAPPTGFARRVVERLVLDETSLLSAAGNLLVQDAGAPAETGRQQVDAAAFPEAVQFPEAVHLPATHRSARSGALGKEPVGGRATPPVRIRTRSLVLYLAGMLCVALGLLSLASDLGYLDGKPERRARLILTAAAETFDGTGQRLARGDGLAETQSLRVGRQGLARAEWHDASSKSQPAATFQLTSQGRVQVLDGETLLVQGSLHVTTHRGMTVPVADGSRIDLGVGEYLISAEEVGRGGQGRRSGLAELRVEVEVLRGDPAEIQRRELGSVLVAPGMVGIFRGDSAVDVLFGAGAGQDGALLRRNDPSETAGYRSARLTGLVADRSGQPVVGADVLVAYGSSRVQRLAAAATNAQGAFLLETSSHAAQPACDTPFAIVQVVPPSRRAELGISVPEAIRLGYRDGDAHLHGTPVLDVSLPLVGVVYDDRGLAIEGARIIPCVVDELFGTVLAWPEGQVVSRRGGDFQLRRLPVGLPRHQHLAVIVQHAAFAPMVVAVPARNEASADFFQANLVLPRLRSVRLLGLPAGLMLQVLEELPGLPLGMAAVQRNIVVDGEGRAELAVGQGQLWLRNSSPSHPMLRRLVPAEPQVAGPQVGGSENQPVLRPAIGMPLALSAVFQPLQPLAGTALAIASSHRYQRFGMAPVGLAGAGPLLTVLDPHYGRSIGGAQVFALRRAAARGLPEARFLGFSSGSGTLALDLEPGEHGVAVVAPDGSVGFTESMASGDNVDLLLQGLGRVSVDPDLRPSISSGEHVVTLRFDRLDQALPGLGQSVVRFASAATGWEVAGVPPGTYRVSVSTQDEPLETVIEVLPLGLVVLR